MNYATKQWMARVEILGENATQNEEVFGGADSALMDFRLMIQSNLPGPQGCPGSPGQAGACARCSVGVSADRHKKGWNYVFKAPPVLGSFVPYLSGTSGASEVALGIVPENSAKTSREGGRQHKADQESNDYPWPKRLPR
jgi:hypothetical protein